MKNQMSITKRILLLVLAVPTLFILFILGTIVTSPIFDNIDKGRFETLDKQSKVIYEAVKARSDGTESWKYEASCSDIMSGWMTTGEFLCETSLSTQVDVTTVAQLNALHEKYYPVIDSSSYLKQKTELDKQYPGQFGVDFVVSSAEKKYEAANSSTIACTYLVNLGQPIENSSTSYNQKYGANIATGIGHATISLSCADKARDDWYGSIQR